MAFSVNHPFLYLLSGLVVVFILAQSVHFLVKAARQARKLNIASGVIRKTILSSMLFSVAPAVSILVGVITLSKFLGLPFPWYRLSVLGAVTYELPAATLAASQSSANTQSVIAAARNMRGLKRGTAGPPAGADGALDCVASALAGAGSGCFRRLPKKTASLFANGLGRRRLRSGGRLVCSI